MDRFTGVARRKVADLIRRDDFLQILAINNESVWLEMKGKGCKVDSFGRVDWHDTTHPPVTGSKYLPV